MTETGDWAKRPGHLLTSGLLQPFAVITWSKDLHHGLVGKTTRGIGPMAQLVTVDDICPQVLQPLSY